MTTLLGGKYVLERRLGGGGMAEVFLARTVGAEGFSRPVAIKRVLDGYAANEQFTAMFVSEARLCSRLVHANVVSVLDFDLDDTGRPFLVMELVDGVDLDGLLATGLLPLPVVARIVAEILRGLAYAHDLPIGTDGVRGLVHRDISPHNVLLSFEGDVKVSDFGIAKARAASDATASVFIKGKPAYMSPEQANGQPLDGRSDLFAVGVVLWEALCGRPLFQGVTTQETMARLLFGQVPSPREARPDTPADLERVTMRLLARDREQRYADAKEALADLIACRDYPRSGRELLVTLLAERLAGRAPIRASGIVSKGPTEPTTVGSPARHSAGPRTSTPPTPTPMRMVDPAPSFRSRAPSSRWRWGVLAAVVVVALGGGILAATRQRTGAGTSPDAFEVKAPTIVPVTPPSAGSSTPSTIKEPAQSATPHVNGAAAGSANSSITPRARDAEPIPPKKTPPRPRPTPSPAKPAAGTGSGIQEIKLGT